MDLLHAAECGYLSVVKQLVSQDKSLIRNCRHEDHHNRAFNVKGSAIHYACRSGHLNIVKYLLEQDPTIVNDLDIECWTPLHYACSNGHVNIVKLLLEYNADVYIKDNYLSQTPIQFAMYKQFENIVYLLDPNVSWTRRTSDDISTKGNVPVFRKKSKLFLGRFILDDSQIKQIELFRKNPQSDDIELRNIQDVELSNLNVRIKFTHDSKKHFDETLKLSADENDDLFLRSSTISTNEHIIVFKDE